MQVKVHKLWEYLGDMVIIKEDSEVASKYLPPGVYVVSDKKEYGIILFNVISKVNHLLDEWNEDTEVEILIEEGSNKVQNLLEARIHDYLELLNEVSMHKDAIDSLLKEIEYLKNLDIILKKK
jgi:hypothetical protein